MEFGYRWRILGLSARHAIWGDPVRAEYLQLSCHHSLTKSTEVNDGADGAEQWPMVGEFHVMEWHLALAAEIEELR